MKGHFDNGTVDARSTGGQTHYTISGDLDFVEETIIRIKASYHPLGYGTTFSAPKQNEVGDWVAHGSRANSCD
jgi:hypothetical protein